MTATGEFSVAGGVVQGLNIISAVARDAPFSPIVRITVTPGVSSGWRSARARLRFWTSPVAYTYLLSATAALSDIDCNRSAAHRVLHQSGRIDEHR